MNNFMELLNLNPELLGYLAIDLVIAIGLLCAARFIVGFWAGVSTIDEIAKKDNFAFGISVAGSVTGLGIAMTGAVIGETANTYQGEIVGMLCYGVVGLILIKVGRILHDKLALNRIDKVKAILDRNLSVAIIDAAAVIATAIVIRAVLLWVDGLDLNTLIAVVSGFFVSQLMLVVVTRMRERAYANNNQNQDMQEALLDGQLAVAIRHAGYLISSALAVTAASYFLLYQPTAYVTNLIGWVVVSLIMVLAVKVFSAIAKRIVLWGVDLVSEVDHQHNVGVATIELSISIAVAMVLTSLMS